MWSASPPSAPPSKPSPGRCRRRRSPSRFSASISGSSISRRCSAALLGDRVLGRVRTVTLGALLMTAGHFCLAFDQSFLLALLLLILGAGCLRGNLQPQVGELYTKDDHRRTTAYQIYGAMISFGGFVAPIVTGQLAKSFTWHVGFAFAGFGMLVGLGVYLYGRPYLPPDPPRQVRLAAPPLTPEERHIVWLLLCCCPSRRCSGSRRARCGTPTTSGCAII